MVYSCLLIVSGREQGQTCISHQRESTLKRAKSGFDSGGTGALCLAFPTRTHHTSYKCCSDVTQFGIPALNSTIPWVLLEMSAWPPPRNGIVTCNRLKLVCGSVRVLHTEAVKPVYCFFSLKLMVLFSRDWLNCFFVLFIYFKDASKKLVYKCPFKNKSQV